MKFLAVFEFKSRRLFAIVYKMHLREMNNKMNSNEPLNYSISDLKKF